MLGKGLLSFSAECASLAHVPVLILTVGTPLDEYLNCSTKEIERCLEPLLPFLSSDQLLIVRSTVYPGFTEWLDLHLRSKGVSPQISFCPERIVQGYAVRELQTLPQIISGTTPEAEDRAAQVFLQVSPSVVRLKPKEAELAKLFCNAYRYIHFAVSNQFYMMANSAGIDYYRVLEAMKQDYARAQEISVAGFTAGPCLFKDTMQLSAFFSNGFSLGHAAMLVNEGLPLYLVRQLARRYDLPGMTVGLLGMAFKADSDDPRSSLSYKLQKTFLSRGARVLATDPLIRDDPSLLPLEQVIERSDLLVLCTPHSQYEGLDTKGKPFIDVWNFLGRGGLV